MNQFNPDTEEMEMSEDYKPTYIHEQHNNNCQQFFGPITNCTFTMPTAKPSSNSKSKAPKQKNAVEKRLIGKPMTLKYYTYGNKGVLEKQQERVDIVFRLFSKWGWIDASTSANDFDTLFEGEPRHCNISWKANTTILTILLQELMKQPYIERQTGCSAMSLVKTQFGKTPNSDRTRLDDDTIKKIQLTCLVLDINNPLDERSGRREECDVDMKVATLREVAEGNLRVTKGI